MWWWCHATIVTVAVSQIDLSLISTWVALTQIVHCQFALIRCEFYFLTFYNHDFQPFEYAVCYITSVAFIEVTKCVSLRAHFSSILVVSLTFKSWIWILNENNSASHWFHVISQRLKVRDIKSVLNLICKFGMWIHGWTCAHTGPPTEPAPGWFLKDGPKLFAFFQISH